MIKKIKPGAGIIVIRDFSGVNKILVLKQFDTKDNSHNQGYYDFPKGVKEKGESFIDCAIRECFEESNIKLSDENFFYGLKSLTLSKLHLFIAFTEKDAKITPNPVSGVMEHEMFEWLEPESLRGKLIPYLEPALDWVIDIINSERNLYRGQSEV